MSVAMSADPEGYYSDLGVSPSATADEIRAIYRALAKIYHPDVNPDPAAPERFRRFTTAYEVLSDPERRRASLAFHLRSASDDKIAKAARQLLQFLSWDGVKAEKLASAWAFRPGSAIGQVLLGAMVPVGILLVVMASFMGSDGQRVIYAHLPRAGPVAQLPRSDPPALHAWPVPPNSKAEAPVPPTATKPPNVAIAAPPVPDDISPAVTPAAKSAASAAPPHQAMRCCKDQAGSLALEFDLPPQSAVQLKSSFGPMGPFDPSSYTLPSTFRKGQDRILPDNGDDPAPPPRGPPTGLGRKQTYDRLPLEALDKQAAVPPVVPMAATDGAVFIVQLASFRSEDEAAGEFRRLQSQHPQLVETLQQQIQRADLGASGTFYRLGIGPLSTKDRALGLCRSLIAAGEKYC